MNRVTRHGKHKFQFAGKCHRCGCEFECTDDDTEMEQKPGEMYYYVAVCPECGEMYVKVKENEPGASCD